MADDSLEFATDDNNVSTKLNRKSFFIGSATQIKNLTPTYTGQLAFCRDRGQEGLSDDFSSYVDQAAADLAWVPQDTAQVRVNVSNDNLAFVLQSDNTNDSISYDLGHTLPTSRWRLRFRFNASTISNNAGNTWLIGLSNVPSSSGGNTSQYFIGIEFSKTATFNSFFGLDANGVVPQSAAVDGQVNVTWAASTNYYCELELVTSTRYAIKVFTNSDYATGVVGTIFGDCPATISESGLRYIKFMNFIQSATTSVTAIIDDVTLDETYYPDRYYLRNAANTTWSEGKSGFTSSTSSEYGTTPVTDDTNANAFGSRWYEFFTLPLTEKWYIITGMEWKNSNAPAGNVMCGVEKFDTEPSTTNTAILVAVCAETVAAGVSSVQRSSVVASELIEGGTHLGIWVSSSSNTAAMRSLNVGTSKQRYKTVAYTATPTIQNATAINSSVTGFYIKAYYVGFMTG